jgi:hypothetical protein
MNRNPRRCGAGKIAEGEIWRKEGKKNLTWGKKLALKMNSPQRKKFGIQNIIPFKRTSNF